MLSTILRTIREHELVAEGDRVLVALSGGPDSRALLLTMLRLAGRLGIAVQAATVDHGLRPEAAAEAAAVVAWCAGLGVDCEVLRVDVGGARQRHVSWQDAARRVRLAALEEAAARRGCARVALGHTADDQAETILFRLVRGTGVSGLAGIPHRRGRLVRPLLEVRRREVLRFLARKKVAFFEDPSNADRRFARARVRHDWLPLLARDNPRVVEALLSLGAEVRALPRHPAPSGRLPLSRRVARQVARLAASAEGTRRVSVKGGTVEISYGRVAWQPGPLTAPPRVGEDEMVEITGAGVYRMSAGPAIEVRGGEGAGGAGAGANGAVFDAEDLAWPLRLRGRRDGDRMRPRGGRGTRKLSDLLIDAKVPRPARAALPVLESAEGVILFVPGLRPSAVAAPTPGTRRWIQVRAA